MKYYKWEVIPRTLPTVLRNCPKCGGHSEFECSRNFRVNANRNLLDVWLIYQCKRCNTTWNMEILSRTEARAIDAMLYSRFLKNDHELAAYYAFDSSLHQRNRTTPDYGSLEYDILGDNITLHEYPEKSLHEHPKKSLRIFPEAIQIEIVCKYPVDLRLDKLLSQKLAVSRETLKRMAKQQKIRLEGSGDLGKTKLKQVTRINILP